MVLERRNDMRLREVARTKSRLSGGFQNYDPTDISDRIIDQFELRPRDARATVVKRLAGAAALRLRQRAIRRTLRCSLSFDYDLLCLGERFGIETSQAVLFQLMRKTPEAVLLPGCYLAGEDVQFWLRRGVKRLDGIDVYSLNKRWQQILPELRGHYSGAVHFQQASIEALPFRSETFDLVASAAVLEHVRNLPAMVAETARVLRPGGYAWHEFGPLYFSYGGDHCSAAYGESEAYGHILLDESAYQARINDQVFFDSHSDPNLPFWARKDQFSFATAGEYLRLFNERFSIKHLVVKISPEALTFRDRHPKQWRQMIEAGVSEEDLIIKSLGVILRLPV
jgi:ubiquinone/menaquinone biosynthesis C-methylase UbiE